MKRNVLIILILLLTFVHLHAGWDLNGHLRNDAVVMVKGPNATFSDIIETRLDLSGGGEEWKAFCDLRLTLFSGYIANTMGPMAFRAVKAYIKLTPDWGSISAGKIYAPFGYPDLFNPFERSRVLDFTDLKGDKEGILAVSTDIGLGENGLARLYVSPGDALTNSGAGLQVTYDFPGLKAGIVVDRQAFNQNAVGLFFKGDLEAGLSLNWAFHFDDTLSNRYNEASLTADYSLFDAALLLKASLSYNEKGALQTNDYYVSMSGGSYFKSRFTLFGGLTWVPDDYFSLDVSLFANLIDGSMLVMPSAAYSISDGLRITLIGLILTGVGGTEFSRDTLMDYSVFCRLEGSI